MWTHQGGIRHLRTHLLPALRNNSGGEAENLGQLHHRVYCEQTDQFEPQQSAGEQRQRHCGSTLLSHLRGCPQISGDIAVRPHLLQTVLLWQNQLHGMRPKVFFATGTGERGGIHFEHFKHFNHLKPFKCAAHHQEFNNHIQHGDGMLCADECEQGERDERRMWRIRAGYFDQEAGGEVVESTA